MISRRDLLMLMPPILLTLVVLLISPGSIVTALQAPTLVATAAYDTAIGQGTETPQPEPTMLVLRTDPSTDKTLFHFNVLPEGSYYRVYLSFYVESIGMPMILAVGKVNRSDWTENATWGYANPPETAWAAPGMEAGTDYDATPVATVEVNSTGRYTVEVTGITEAGQAAELIVWYIPPTPTPTPTATPTSAVTPTPTPTPTETPTPTPTPTATQGALGGTYYVMSDPEDISCETYGSYRTCYRLSTTLTFGGGYDQFSSLRFILSGIPQGANIVSATLRISNTNAGADSIDGYIIGIRSSDTITAPIRNVGVAYESVLGYFVEPVRWLQANACGSSPCDITSPEIARILNYFVNQPTWAPGTPIEISLYDTGSSTANNLQYNSAGGTPTIVPRIVLTYTSGGPTPTPMPTSTPDKEDDTQGQPPGIYSLATSGTNVTVTQSTDYVFPGSTYSWKFQRTASSSDRLYLYSADANYSNRTDFHFYAPSLPASTNAVWEQCGNTTCYQSTHSNTKLMLNSSGYWELWKDNATGNDDLVATSTSPIQAGQWYTVTMRVHLLANRSMYFTLEINGDVVLTTPILGYLEAYTYHGLGLSPLNTTSLGTWTYYVDRLRLWDGVAGVSEDPNIVPVPTPSLPAFTEPSWAWATDNESAPPGDWTSVYTNTNGRVEITTTQVYSGTSSYVYYSTASTSSSAYTQRTFGSATSVFTTTFWLYMEPDESNTSNTDIYIARYLSGSQELYSLKWFRNIGLMFIHPYTNMTTAIGTKNLTFSQWHKIDVAVKIADSGGYYRVWVDDQPYISWDGDTKYSTYSTVDRVRLGNNNTSGTYKLYIDAVKSSH